MINDAGVKTPAEGGPDVLPVFEKLQPDSIFYHSRQRADVRWIGNELGYAGQPCWATMPSVESQAEGHKQESWARQFLENGDPNGSYWSPAMVDIPLRGANGVHNWFYKPGQDHGVYPLEDLLKIYDQSVGRNCNLVIGATIQPDGLCPQADVDRLDEFGREVKRRYGSAIASASGSGAAGFHLPGRAGVHPVWNGKGKNLSTKNNLKKGKKMKKSVLFALVLFGTASLFASNRLNAEWEYLFNGKDLDGWVQRGGKATYEVVGDAIVGTTVLNTPNSFLCTKKSYANFVFEVEFFVGNMNSGIQIRSQSLKDYKNGRVHGYQVEIDPSDRAWTGGIYDEARRGWLYDLRNNEAARKAFKKGEWNKLHIEAIGGFIRTWINGVPAANLYDTMTPEGFIALQVHGSKIAGEQVKWRNIRILDLGTTTNFPTLKK